MVTPRWSRATKATVGDGDAVGVAGEVGEHRFRPGEGRLGVDKPLFPHKRCEVRGEGVATTEALDLTKERQPARRMGIGERRPEEPPEQAGKPSRTRIIAATDRHGTAP